MHTKVLITLASVALMASGSVSSSAGEPASANAQQKRIGHHQKVVHPSRDITSFSSSSALHIGVNRPPKNR